MQHLIVPLGIATYVSIILTILSGFAIFKWHVKWVKMKMHIWLAILTLILASIHAGIVMSIL